MLSLNWPESARNVDSLGVEQKKYESMRLERMMPMIPIFDCRVFQVPNQQIVFENIVWRWMDARKNSVEYNK